MISKSKIILLIIIILATFLRFYKLAELSPYWEEVALGYDAYSILQTGKDHHGNILPIVAFESFGDYKPSLYFYSLVPSIAIFGLNTFSIRFVSAFAGVLTILLIYLLVQQLLKASVRKNEKMAAQEKEKNKISSPNLIFTIQYSQFISLFSAFSLTIMPWHIMVSRTGFETNLGLFLVTLAVWMFFKGKNLSSNKKINWWWIGDIIIASLSLYSYHGYRVFTPLLIITLVLIFWKNLWQNKKSLIISVVLFIFLVIPIGMKITDSSVNQRFSETSAFATLEPIIKSNAAILEDGGGFFPKLLHHRFWYYGEIYVQNYLSHFTPQFLMLTGDKNIRHSTQFTGQLFYLQFGLFAFGIFFIFYFEWSRKKLAHIVITWLLLSPVAAGITRAVPHALRTLPMVIPIAILSGFGGYGIIIAISSFIQLNFKKHSFFLKKKNYLFASTSSNYLILALFIFISIFELTRFWHYYITIYPNKYSMQWQYGYKQAITYVNQNYNNYDQIFFTRKYGRPAMYYWFYSKTDPKSVQNWNSISAKDQGEYLNYKKISFQSATGESNSLIVTSEAMPNSNLINQINFLDGQGAFYFYEK